MNAVDLVRIEWPSGTVQELSNVASKQFLTEGSRYAIETSTTLPNWTSATLTVTVTNQSGALTFPAPSATTSAQRFYRAVWQ